MKTTLNKHMLNAPGSKRLKLKHHKLLSNLAFNFNLRRYIMGVGFAIEVGRCRLTVSKPVFKATMPSALETIIL